MDLAALVPFVPDITTNYITEASGLAKIIASVTYVSDKFYPTMSLELRDANIVTSPAYGVTLNGLTAKLAMQNLNPPRAEPGQTIQINQLKVNDDIALRNVHIEFGIARLNADEEDLGASLAAGDAAPERHEIQLGRRRDFIGRAGGDQPARRIGRHHASDSTCRIE